MLLHTFAHATKLLLCVRLVWSAAARCSLVLAWQEPLSVNLGCVQMTVASPPVVLV